MTHCLFCQSRNIQEKCVKLMSAEFNPSRALSRNNAECSGSDRMLFEYAYSDALFYILLDVSELLKTLAVAFGNVPPYISLKHAICSLAASYLPKEQYQRHFASHKTLALRALVSKINNPATIVDADVFAAGVLVYAICAGNNVRNTDMLLATKICTTMFRHLTENSTMEKPLSDLLTIFGAASVDFCASRLFTLRVYPLSHSMPVIRSYQTSFRQRVKYYGEFIRITSIPAAWQSDIVEACLDTVGRLLLLSFSCVCEICTKEMENDFERSDVVGDVIQFIQAELADPDFVIALESMGGPETVPEGYTMIEGWVALYVFLAIGCLDILDTLLKKPGILCGLHALEATPTGQTLIPWCRWEDLRGSGFPLEYTGFVPFIHSLALVLGGCALQEGESTAR